MSIAFSLVLLFVLEYNLCKVMLLLHSTVSQYSSHLCLLVSSTIGDEINPGSSWQDHNVKGGDLIASLQPLRIHEGPIHLTHPPTLPECEVIIRHLYNANSSQSQEVGGATRPQKGRFNKPNIQFCVLQMARVKSLLREIVRSKKINPETHILTKAHLVDGTRWRRELQDFSLHQHIFN